MITFKLADYVAYFKQIAAANADILHTEQSPKVFFLTIPEILSSSLQTGIGEYFIVLENPSLDTRGTWPQPIYARQGAFHVLAACSQADHEAQWEAWDKAEQIGLALCNKIAEDAEGYQVDAIVGFNYNAIQVDPVGPLITNCYGKRFQFEMISR